MILLMQNGSGQMSSAPKNKNPEPRLKEVPAKTVDAIFAEAEMLLSVGGRALDASLEDRLESVSRDSSLPAATRARALSLLCRFG